MTETPTRTRRARADRPPPDWEQVYRRNFLERLKRDRPPVDVRAELPDLIARGYEAVPEEDMVRLHWWGIAHDKPKVGTFMVRVKVPGGVLTASQVRGLGRIAREHARDGVELTTRQGVQLHWVSMADLPTVVAEVEAIGLSTAGAEGDTVRNVTGCPVAGLSGHDVFDVTDVVREVAAFFGSHPDYKNLPRKHKYTISACPAQCNAPEISDVALVAVLQNGRRGFALRVGGGMANTPRISRDVGVFIPVEDTVEVLRAVTDAWQTDLRYRMSRARARIKFMIDDLGPEAFRARVEHQLGHALGDGVAPDPVGGADHLGVHPQRDGGRVYVGVPVPSGRLSGTTLTHLADLVDDIGGDLRLTRQQNFVLGHVPGARVEEVSARLAELGVPVDRSRAVGRSVACTSNRFCNYSVAETKDKLDGILTRLEATHGAERLSDLAIHLDGCPHACAQHWVGEIGLQGTTTHDPDTGERVEAYDLSVGGGLGRRTAIGRRLVRRVPTKDVEDVLDRLVGAWLAEQDRTGGRPSFGEFCDLLEDDELLAVSVGARGSVAGPGERVDAGVLVRVPGPLQRYVDGADELSVDGRTVGGVLAEVTRRHPQFGSTVLPDGEVAGAFLVTVGDQDIRGLQGLSTDVTPNDTITIVMAMAGG
ncbi:MULTISPECIES: MoaD/ThiS family protein [unclassified Nocardioides]|uniref:MoaD/ThiS family protein n=1 Tax=unclassified Nocardioides TaxID=2615069 RepID=UPI000056F336|nr:MULTISPECIES: MoaD/ThiS family protein [unclassified Nocardioides]ABL83293.1 sulfite reductase (ferredoxin) [Nocardioides sp. JS614]